MLRVLVVWPDKAKICQNILIFKLTDATDSSLITNSTYHAGLEGWILTFAVTIKIVKSPFSSKKTITISYPVFKYNWYSSFSALIKLLPLTNFMEYCYVVQ